MLDDFRKIGQEAMDALQQVSDAGALEEFRIKYLGRKGLVTGMLSQIGKLPPEQKREGGQLANTTKKQVTAAFDELKSYICDQLEETIVLGRLPKDYHVYLSEKAEEVIIGSAAFDMPDHIEL